MKNSFILLFTFLSLFLFSEKRGPDYIIKSSVPGNKPSKTESSFIFLFYDPLGHVINSAIRASDNKQDKVLKTGEEGKAIYKVKPGKHIFQFLYTTACDEIYTDSITIKPGYITTVNVYFRDAGSNIIADKPVIYVYSPKQEVSIKLKLDGEFLFTYPEYNNSWNFTANPNGVIETGNKKYNYLFWDGKLNIDPPKAELTKGFIVEKKNLVTFFEEKLSAMGLNSQEIEDYITYWCPRMNANEKSYIHFLFNEEYNKYAAITIDPKPDHLFRVCMLWCKAGTAPAEIMPESQKIESFKRGGLTVVEWGGAEMAPSAIRQLAN